MGFAAKAGVPLAIETVSVPKVKRLRRVLQKRRPVFALFSNRAEVAAITGKECEQPARSGQQRALAA